MGNLLIKIKNSNTVVNLSPFNNLSGDINWGDDITDQNKSHTYSDPGTYSIFANFEEVDKILDNFTINGLQYIDFQDFENLTEIGDNFLSGSEIKFLDLSKITPNNIGDNFVNNCTLLETILLADYVPDLKSWGSNIGPLKIFSSIKSYEQYRKKELWNTGINPTRELILLDFTYDDNVSQSLVESISFRNNKFIENNLIDLSINPTLSSAINNNSIKVYDEIPYIVDESTRYSYKDEESIKKTFFIYLYTYFFKDNPNSDIYNTYIYMYPRILQALKRIQKNDSTFLEVKQFDNETEYYNSQGDTPLEEIIDNNTQRYLISDVLSNEENIKVLKFDTSIEDTKEFIDESNMINIDESIKYNAYKFSNNVLYLQDRVNVDSLSDGDKVNVFLLEDGKIIQSEIKGIINKNSNLILINYDNGNYSRSLENDIYYTHNNVIYPVHFRGYIMFGLLNELNNTNAPYSGEIDNGMTIDIKASGLCKNLIIYDYDYNEEIRDREHIKINTEYFSELIDENGQHLEANIIENDEIIIKTSKGEKSAYLIRRGRTYNILKYIDRSSSWLTVKQGDNLFFAVADKDLGTVFNIKIKLKYNELYEGV